MLLVGLQYGYSKMVSYHLATFSAGASIRAVQDWISRWRRDSDGFEAAFSWGGQSFPAILMEEDVMESSQTWWRENAPKKGVSFCMSLVI